MDDVDVEFAIDEDDAPPVMADVLSLPVR